MGSREYDSAELLTFSLVGGHVLVHPPGTLLACKVPKFMMRNPPQKDLEL